MARNRNDPARRKAATDPVPRVLFDATGAVVDTVGRDDRFPPRVSERPIWVHLPDGRFELSVPIPTSAEASFTLTRMAE